MKKKILILAAIAVSGIAAVVASNTNAFVCNDAEANVIEITEGGTWYFCISQGAGCSIQGHGWEMEIPGYSKITHFKK